MATPTEPYDWRAALIADRRTLAWAADMTGKSRRTVYAYSRGDLVPPTEWIERVRRLLEEKAA